ncbi:PadR family transcriptional regulator [Tamaricihabitans halophyticus]|uniref:PadR family transcriptional regulator n=1 Tax=Tamaricihabitans halophyticus TaxID=1262583 RepID=A0A4R2R3F2_9PSEU|nr:PadR family transcriptional regulator [Tamaricihabitans halophyticus]TCP56384.1 PadR family transcriptional regulator [Tamaricihabitans halophyticus]
MSATRLLVLGAVRMYGKAHGYQVRRELQTWSADRWAKAQPGSIYHALKKMAAEGLLEVVDTEPGKAGPDRTGYRLTSEGETHYQVLLSQAVVEADPWQPQTELFFAGMSLLPTMPRKQAISALRQRVTTLRAQRSNWHQHLESSEGWGEPPHVFEMYRLWGGQVHTAIEWTEQLIDKLAAGEFVMADDSAAAFGAPPSNHD